MKKSFYLFIIIIILVFSWNRANMAPKIVSLLPKLPNAKRKKNSN